MFARAVEQYEGLTTGPVLVYVLHDFDKTLIQSGYVAAAAGVVYSASAFVLSGVAGRFGRRPLMIWPVFGYALVSPCSARWRPASSCWRCWRWLAAA